MKIPPKFAHDPSQTKLYRTQNTPELSQFEQDLSYRNSLDLNKRSTAWRYFDYDQKSNAAICKLCYAVYQVKKSVTTPMMRHLREEHETHFTKKTRRRGGRESTKAYRDEQSQIQSNFEQKNQYSDMIAQNKKDVKNFFYFNSSHETAICQICGKYIQIEDQSTTPLHQHMKEYHILLYSNSQEPQKKTSEHIPSTSRRVNPYQNSNSQERENNEKKENEFVEKNKAIIWNYFLYLERQHKSMCRICREWINSPNKSSVDVCRHLQAAHSEVLSEQLSKFNQIQEKQHLRNQQPKVLGTSLQNHEADAIKIKNEVDQAPQVNRNLNNIHGNQKPFILDKKRQVAICQWCKSIYVVESNDLTQFKLHIQSMHPGVSMNDYCTETSAYQNRFFMDKIGGILGIVEKQQDLMEISEEEDEEILMKYQNNLFSQLKFDMKMPQYRTPKPQKQEMSQQKQQEKVNNIAQLLSTLFLDSKERLLSVLMQFQKQLHYSVVKSSKKLESIILIKKQRNCGDLTQQIIGIWEYRNPLYNSHLKSIIYVTKHNKDISPEFFMICLVFKDDLPTFVQIRKHIQKFFQRQRKILLCCSHRNKLRIERMLLGNNPQSGYIAQIKQQILENNIDCREQVKKIRNQLINPQISENFPFFIGFSVTQKFINQIKQVSPSSFGIKAQLSELLESMFDSLNSIKQKHLKEIQEEGDETKLIIQKACQNPEMTNLKQHLLPDIFTKLCVSYLFGWYHAHFTAKGSDLLMAETKLYDNQEDEETTMVVLKYNQFFKEIECGCNLYKWVGIPCPHMIRTLKQMKLPIRQCINQRWFIKPINSLQTWPNQSINQSQCERVQWMPDSEQKFLERFWR